MRTAVILVKAAKAIIVTTAARIVQTAKAVRTVRTVRTAVQTATSASLRQIRFKYSGIVTGKA